MRSPRPLPIIALALLLWASLPTAGAAAHGLQLAALPPANAGKLEVQIDLSEASLRTALGSNPTADRFRAVTADGSPKVIGVRPFDPTSEAIYTVLAFDHSGSFRHHWDEAMALARGFADGLPSANHRVQVVTFGLRLDDQGVATNAAELKGLLETLATKRPNQVATRLKSFIHDAAKLAADALPPGSHGSRQLIVFTDAGEESDAYDVKTLISEALDLGVRIHVVGLYRKGRQSDALAGRMDEMKRLAEGSGGFYIQVDETAAALRSIGELARIGDRLFWLDLEFCGLPTRGYFQDQLRIELLQGGSRIGWSPEVAFRQDGSGAATAPCPCDPACAAGESCIGGACVAASPQPSATTVSTTAPPGVPPSRGLPWWLWALAAVGAIVLLLWGIGRKAEARAPMQPPPVSPPPVEEVREEAFVAPLPTPWVNPLEMQLPSTRLVITRGPAGLERVHRITKQDFVVGALAGQVDLAIDLPQISGRHATFQLFKSGAVFVRDEGSTNGTFVAGRRLGRHERVQLQPDQPVGLGTQVELRIEQGQQQIHAPAAPAPESAPPQAAEELHARSKARTIYAPVKSKRGPDEP